MEKARERSAVTAWRDKGKYRKVTTKINAPVPKGLRGISGEHAFAHLSALPPTRLALVVNYPAFINLIESFAVLTTYEMQSAGNMPSFNGVNASLIEAYYLTIASMHLLEVGAIVTVSNQFTSVSEYAVPTFFAKWLQQISPSTHLGRQVNTTFNSDINISSFFNQPCGTGGIQLTDSGFLPAPCITDASTGSEPAFSIQGSGSPGITPENSSAKFNLVSEIITKVFKHVCYVKNIPKRAKSTELKCTPVGQTLEGQFLYSAVDEKTMCDFLLPLCSIYENTLVNSPSPVQAAAPVRLDTALATSAPGKIAFMFWLANSYAFNSEDTFLTYLRKFGIKDQHFSNMQLNIRQVNWLGVLQSIFAYLNAFDALTNVQAGYFINYCITVLVSNIPAAFRAINVLQQQWGIVPAYKALTAIPNYAASCKGAKVPPFLANMISAVKKPIRTGNQISYFICSMPSEGDGTAPFWNVMFKNANGTLGNTSQYGQIPADIMATGLNWTTTNVTPYPGFTQVPPVGYPDYTWNWCTLNGISAIISVLQDTFQNSGQPVVSTWLGKHPKLSARHARFYSLLKLSGVFNYGQFNTAFLTTEEIMSWEPCAYHPALDAIANVINYYSPNLDVTNKSLSPIFSANPNTQTKAAVSTAINASYPGQGTSTMVKAAASSNPEEVLAHTGASANEGLISDNSISPPEHLKAKVETKAKEMIHSATGTAIEKGVEKGTKILTKVASSLL